MSFEAEAVDLPLRVGARTLARLRRRLVRISFSLEDALGQGTPIRLPPLPPKADGFLLFGLPKSAVKRLAAGSGLRPFVRQQYPRWFASLDQDFDAYLSGFSGKTRSTLKRKLRKFAEESGGRIDIRGYRRPQDAEEYCRHAHAVSALSYQERLLDAGLPEDAAEEMRALAELDAVRAWLLFLDGRPVSYLYAPAAEDTLIYAYLGYDPAVAHLSPGTVLQLEAMRMLMAERRFRWFDFTEGDGQHKRQFATGSVESVDLLLLRPNFTNVAIAKALGGFDKAVALAKRAANSLGAGGVVRAVRR